MLTTLAACGSDIREMPLDTVDLSDRQLVADFSAGLPAQDRAALATYIIAHWPASPNFCGEVLIDEEGRQPTTIGEAISMTKVREEQRQARIAEAQRPKTAIEQLIDRKNYMSAEIDKLIFRRTYLLTKYGNESANPEEFQSIAEQIASAQDEIKKLDVELAKLNS